MTAPLEPLLTVFRALADPSRLRILLLVGRMELSVGELAQLLGQSQPRVSRHLRILAEAGLVERAREGAWVFVRQAALAAPWLAAIGAAAGAAEPGAEDAARLAMVRAERAAAADAWFAAHAESWDQERSLASRDTDVEAAILAALGGQPLGDFVDIGTGTGRMIELLGPAAGSATGIDRSPEMLRLARGRIEAAGLPHAQVRHGDMYALPREDGSADTVILHQVLHFADDPAAAIAEAARVLRPGGRLLVVDLAAHEREELRSQRRHLRLGFTDAQVSGWMADSGLAGGVAAHLPSEAGLAVTIWLGTSGNGPSSRASFTRRAA